MQKRGFTLIELSIVLVIIGLIVGGVLVGRDLITTAQLRKTVSLITEIETATMTFKAKYNALPGTTPILEPYYDATPCTANGLVTLNYVWPSVWNVNLFFGQLHTAGLSRYGAEFVDSQSTLTIGKTYPELDFANNGFLLVSTEQAANQDGDGCAVPYGTTHYIFMLGTQPDHYFGIGHNIVHSPVFTPNEAYYLDSKMDDGAPMSGRVKARNWRDGWGNPLAGWNISPFQAQPEPASSAACVSDASGNPYLSIEKTPQCVLSYQTNF